MKHTVPSTILSVALMTVFLMPLASADDLRPVEARLNELKEQSAQNVPPAVIEAGLKGIEEMIKAGISDRALHTGDSMPSFTLSDANGNMVKSGDLLSKGPMVLVFYRGAWCPFCNIYLHSIQEYVDEIEALGGTLVAISGESPDNTLTVAQKNELTFTVLSDPNFDVARSFKIVYEMPTVVNDVILELGFDLTKYYGTDKPELPLSATYIIDREGIIKYAFLDPDYKKRAEPNDLLAELKKLQ